MLDAKLKKTKKIKLKNPIGASGKPLIQISFSGGRTSAYMTKMLIDHFSDMYEFIVTYANTGLEDVRTLDFIHNCDKYFGFNTVWIEAVIDPVKGKGTKHKVVTYETATRRNDLFEEMIKKYGIPNKVYPHCTRELKLKPMKSYIRSIGINPKAIPTALGIRTDEERRVSKEHEAENIIYPLIDLFPADKQDVLDFWADQTFDLGLEEWDGNCRGCFKKSFKKLFKQLDSNGSAIDFHIEMEHLYPQVGNKEGYLDRVFFRGNTSGLRLMEMYVEDRNSDNPSYRVEDGGCSESCEVYSAG